MSLKKTNIERKKVLDAKILFTTLVLLWVEPIQSNFCINPADIRLSPPYGTMLTGIQMLNTDVCRC